MNSVKIQLPTEISYWGSTATESMVERILDNLEILIKNEFHQYNIVFERTPTPTGDGIFCDEEDVRQDIIYWIQNNWAAAL
jgi:uncharacterized protein YbdZ (MbtH family)